MTELGRPPSPFVRTEAVRLDAEATMDPVIRLRRAEGSPKRSKRAILSRMLLLLSIAGVAAAAALPATRNFVSGRLRPHRPAHASAPAPAPLPSIARLPVQDAPIPAVVPQTSADAATDKSMQLTHDAGATSTVAGHGSSGRAAPLVSDPNRLPKSVPTPKKGNVPLPEVLPDGTLDLSVPR